MNVDEVKFIGGFESFVYEFNKNNRDYILRISHSFHRSIDMFRGEIEWVNYLSDCGVSVSKAVKSEGGELIEKVDVNDSYFIAVAFEKAKGRHVNKEDFGEKLYKNWGREIGKIHKATKDYRVSSPDRKRPSWENDFLTYLNYIPKSQTKIIEKAKEMHNYLKGLTTNTDSYGLIHTDPHHGNFFIDEDYNITFFDFDDATYKWFASDICIPLFYKLDYREGKDNREFAKKFMSHFLEGYCKSNSLDASWIKEIPTFLKMRELILYSVIHRSMDINNLQGWVEIFMNNRKHRIENDIPVVDIDFGKIL